MTATDEFPGPLEHTRASVRLVSPVSADTVTVVLGHGEVPVMASNSYSQEFKEQIVALHRKGRSFMELARSSTLRRRRSRTGPGSGQTGRGCGPLD